MGEGQNREKPDARRQRPEIFGLNSELPLSVYMITYNNGATIAKALQSVAGWANEVVVVDSHSTDRALDTINHYTDKVYQHDTKDLREKYQFAQDRCINPWVMFIDADEWLTSDIKEEISRLVTGQPPYLISFPR